MGNFSLDRISAPAFVTAAVAALLLVTNAGPAAAHDADHHRVSSQKIKLSWDFLNGKKNKFQYKTKGQLAINDLSANFNAVATNLIVRGTGPGDGTTSVIRLDPAGWSTIGTKGWRYKADTRVSTSKGVKQIKLLTRTSGGSMQIKGKGQFWDYPLFQQQSGVEVLLTVDSDVFCAQYDDSTGELTKNEGSAASGKLQGKDSVPPSDCFAVCGNGVLELGEECDDGNDDDDDTCSNGCLGCDVSEVEFNSTFEGIQSLIFDSPVFNCSDDLCHGANFASNGNLDLRDGASYAQLVNVPSPNWAGNPYRVQPGDEEFSLLYSKLAHATLGTPTLPSTGQSMPQGGNPALTQELLDAVDLWIRGGAPEGTVVEGTAELLGACLPAPSPKKIPQPPAPAAGTGVQFTLPSWPLDSQAEDEICVPFYYDISDPAITPLQYRVPCPVAYPDNDTGECFALNRYFVAQDPQSHHVIMRIYQGASQWSDPDWGTWTCHEGTNDGNACNPTTPSVCPGGVCAGDTKSGVACLSLTDPFGPADWGFLGGVAPQYLVAQEATRVVDFPTSSYVLLPLKGVMVWNSHAFNLTTEDMTMEGWLNIDFQSDQQHEVEELFQDDYIFTQQVPAFGQEEYCATHTFAQDTNLFQLTSHTHRHGKRFRVYAPPQTPCPAGPPGPSGLFNYTDPNCLAGNPADLMYETFDYSDPLELRWVDSPLVYSSASANDRTFKFCALYDNGATDPAEVKLQSNSPPPPNPLTPGGPCSNSEVKCLGGPNQGIQCFADDNACPNGVCDACDLTGGVRTEDEMMILMGFYYVD